MKKIFKVIMLLIMLSLLFFSGCSSSKENNENLNIVVTTTMLFDLTKIIGGEKVNVNGLMGPGIDPHLYKASAGDVTLLKEADIVIYNGLHLEGKLTDIFESLNKKNKNIIQVSDYIEKEKLIKIDDTDIYDPHLWFDVNLWMDIARGLANELSKNDTNNTNYYQDNLKKYLKELEDLNNYIKNKVDELVLDKRILITAHDAFNYFGRTYGFEVKGLQGISTDSEAGTSDVSKLANFIFEKKVKAIFVESSIHPKTIESLQAATKARGFEVIIGGKLYSDSLGDKKSQTETYIKTFKFNIDTIVNSLK